MFVEPEQCVQLQCRQLTVVVKWSEGISNKMSIIIRRYEDYMRFTACMFALLIAFFSYSLLLLYIILYMVV